MFKRQNGTHWCPRTTDVDRCKRTVSSINRIKTGLKGSYTVATETLTIHFRASEGRWWWWWWRNDIRFDFWPSHLVRVLQSWQSFIDVISDVTQAAQWYRNGLKTTTTTTATLLQWHNARGQMNYRVIKNNELHGLQWNSHSITWNNGQITSTICHRELISRNTPLRIPDIMRTNATDSRSWHFPVIRSAQLLHTASMMASSLTASLEF